jgi:3-isopropylmalate dehydrogenase
VLAAATDGVELVFESHEAGAGHYLRHGEVFPDHVRERCRSADAVLLAAIGLLDARRPDGTEVSPEMMMALRRDLDLYAAVRPIKLYEGVPSPLARTERGIDLVILRENLEGLFASFGGGCVVGEEAATDTLLFTRRGVERVCEFAFDLAARRDGRPLDRRRGVTCVDKANVFRSFAFFRRLFFEAAERHPSIHADAAYVDAMSLLLVAAPESCDVLVMENLLGDILSDLGAGLVGGLGMAPSAEVGDAHALFQPSHGTAEALAGKNVANPYAMILSGAMMLEWLARRHDDPRALAAARRIERAVERALRRPQARTRDLGGEAGTRDVASAVVDALE